MNTEHPVLFPSDPVPAKAYVRQRLKAVEPVIRRCILEAFAVLHRLAAVDRIVPDALEYMCTRQKMMNSLGVTRVRREFGKGIAGVSVREDSGFVELRVNDEIDLRFKLVDEGGRSCNANTEAQKRYRNQIPLLGIDVLEPIRLTVGWRWNATATDLEDIVISLEKGDYPAWTYSILGDDAGEFVNVAKLPIPDDAPKPARVRVPRRKSVRDGDGG